MTFDIERYKANSKKLDLDDIRWDLVREHELEQAAIDSMLYMMDIETHTVIYLSELLVSKACMDPVITAFLSCWAYEEMYHGEAFVRFLREYGIPVSDQQARGASRLREGFGRVNAVMAIMFGSYVFPFFPALYLTVGAINELTTPDRLPAAAEPERAPGPERNPRAHHQAGTHPLRLLPLDGREAAGRKCRRARRHALVHAQALPARGRGHQDRGRGQPARDRPLRRPGRPRGGTRDRPSANHSALPGLRVHTMERDPRPRHRDVGPGANSPSSGLPMPLPTEPRVPVEA